MKTNRRKFLSVLTLVFFFTTMSAFVAYKAGAFGEEFENQVQSTLFAGNQSNYGADSPGRDSVKPQVIMPSSKVGIGTVEPKPTKDSPAKNPPANSKVNNSGDKPVNNAPPANNATEKPRDTYIYSTKSGPVFTPKTDTQQQQQQQKPKH